MFKKKGLSENIQLDSCSFQVNILNVKFYDEFNKNKEYHSLLKCEVYTCLCC